MTDNSGWGGSRKGAGRKKGGTNSKPKIARSKISFMLPTALLDKLEDRAQKEGMPKSWIIKEALEAYLK